jgi:alkylation response protein AidB-like acyl-CoA dehydrogenase
VVGLVAAQAREADLTRTVSRDVVEAIKESGLLALSATDELGGASGTVADVAAELEVLVTACASTAWCVWNHLCVFHLFCGALSPEHTDLLAGIVERREWVCFPAGAGSGVHATDHGEHLALDGPAAFGSGARYADWAGVAFAMAGPDGTVIRPIDMRFSIVRLDADGVEVRPTWDGAGLRASATDDVVYAPSVYPPRAAVARREPRRGCATPISPSSTRATGRTGWVCPTCGWRPWYRRRRRGARGDNG